MDYILFDIDKTEYGISLKSVREVIKISKIDPLLGTPNFIEGIISLRGHNIAVIDLRKKLGMTVSDNIKKGFVIAGKVNQFIMGFIVSKINGIVPIRMGQIDSTSQIIHSVHQVSFVQGITRINNKPILIIHLDQVFEPTELAYFNE